MTQSSQPEAQGEPTVGASNGHHTCWWRIAAVWSSAYPDRIPWLCSNPQQAERCAAHKDFVMWLTPPRTAALNETRSTP